MDNITTPFTSNDYSTQQLLELDSKLKTELDLDIPDLMELEEEMLGMFSLFSELSEGKEVLVERDLGFSGLDLGGSLPTDSNW
ncbi:hypothetical protein [Sabulibacter ruber]|uniref:hypothetical protein n=1 Tax=Sabulibacter ruber TaxID=2811901 RepID=UPI001A976454|nr:hypothetical protein [Sabulibacter ruber]